MGFLATTQLRRFSPKTYSPLVLWSKSFRNVVRRYRPKTYSPLVLWSKNHMSFGLLKPLKRRKIFLSLHRDSLALHIVCPDSADGGRMRTLGR